ncbi:hypothetical protein ASPWEDRAFT_47105 [Aspergillus wentii DTO 134E9]|uniref:Arrestin-like N-terminal domain-containing protein n=1 Tax=Aspergillus wentii DTO 134E9 TaxID=1073089 RepID=A0A1L9RZD5_ASPWE|nr:uncharacterized protein ASPWEDRAFT_47105 [Aspergillus wentii DTO 134E9]OJJ40234.1 hypothetical protein ASPWEDRAFT_47105 [Aspergillus wentii DTO 134E9]
MAASILTRGSSTLESLTKRSRPQVQIDLAGQKQGLVNSYTTGDRIVGTVNITVDHDVRFDEIDITLEGTSRTTVERVSMPGRTGAYQTFLKLRQPIDRSAYPTPRVFESGRSYRFPFEFVVPDRLLPQVCKHQKTNAHVESSHTLLPPTMGDPMLASNGKSLLDDLTPEMCQISYLVRATVLRRPAVQGEHIRTVVSVGKKVRVVPVVEEEPPLNIADDDRTYCLRKEKDVKRGLMRGKLGRLVVATSQPKPIQLPAPTTASPDSVNTVTTVHLRFDPVGNEQPPRLGSVWSKLKATTYYSAIPWSDYPNQSGTMLWTQVGRGLYNETIPLSTLCVASAQWTKHSTADDTNALIRRDSLQSNSSAESLTGPSASFAGSTYYTASVVVPISLPKEKSFVPTFHSCLTSRVYQLDLSISYHTPNAHILTPTASLSVPIQFTSLPPADKATKPSSPVHIITQEEVDQEFFNPRSVAPPSTPAPGYVDYTATAAAAAAVEIAPPEYSATRPVLTFNLS